MNYGDGGPMARQQDKSVFPLTILFICGGVAKRLRQ